MEVAMSRRKVFVLGAVVLAAMLSVGFFIPAMMPSTAGKWVEELRACLTPIEQETKIEGVDSDQLQIQLEVIIAHMDTTKLGVGVFASVEGDAAPTAAFLDTSGR